MANFDEIEIGSVVSSGSCVVSDDALAGFIKAFAPDWNADDGAPDALVFALWVRLEKAALSDWERPKRLAVDALRWVRNPPSGEMLRGRMTIMGKDPVGDDKGIVIAQHDLLDEGGRLVFSCLTRCVVGR